jgi:hypothetical protein
MSWLFSQALVGEYLEANSLDGTPFVPSNTTPTPQAFLWRDKTTDAWTRFPSGMTCEPLTDDRGEALLTWFRADFLAPTSAYAAEARALTDSIPVYGGTWHELSVKFARDLSLWRTHQSLFPEDLPESLVILPKWGWMRDGELLEPTTSRPLTSATEFGFWPTVRAQKATSENEESWMKRNRAGKVSTPPLGLAVKMWRSPTSRDWKNARNPKMCDANGGYRQTSLSDQLCNKSGSTVAERNGQVTPEFCEWLMGFPVGWTESAPLETPKFQQWQLSHGVFLVAPQHTTQHND